MTAAPRQDALRRRTRSHYDRYPFRLDGAEILEEKLENRLMGAAIRELRGDRPVVVDVGCGACRVATLVASLHDALTVNVDLSRETLRSARRRGVGGLVNADNLRLPLRSGSADLVISNGVIHHTPDPRRSFLELARIAGAGGTLVVSVYRRGWYEFTYRYPGAVVRWLRRRIGDRGLRVTVFPFFHVGAWALLSAATRRWFPLSTETSWNLFHDQLTTPQCTFHTFDELAAWSREAGLTLEDRRVEAARQLATVKLRRAAA